MSKGIDGKVIEDARALAAARAEKETTFPDSEVSGLCIRVKGSRATWHLRSKPNKIDLGELSCDLSPSIFASEMRFVGGVA